MKSGRECIPDRQLTHRIFQPSVKSADEIFRVAPDCSTNLSGYCRWREFASVVDGREGCITHSYEAMHPLSTA